MRRYCPACGSFLRQGAITCLECGKRFAGGYKCSVKTVRENTGLGPKEAIERFSGVYKTKTELAYQLGISRNSLYNFIERFNLHSCFEVRK